LRHPWRNKHYEESMFEQKDFDISIEGINVRIQKGNLNYLFGNISNDEFIRSYEKQGELVDDYFKKIFDNNKIEMDDDEIDYLIIDITLHWMYFYNVNRKKIIVKISDLKHPQTRRLIKEHLQNIYDNESKIDELAKKIMNVSEKEYRKWCEYEKMFSEMW
jgi:hypothetical protein